MKKQILLALFTIAFTQTSLAHKNQHTNTDAARIRKASNAADIAWAAGPTLKELGELGYDVSAISAVSAGAQSMGLSPDEATGYTLELQLKSEDRDLVDQVLYVMKTPTIDSRHRQIYQSLTTNPNLNPVINLLLRKNEKVQLDSEKKK